MKWYTEEITDEKTGKRKTRMWYFLNTDTVLVSEAPTISTFLEKKPVVAENPIEWKFRHNSGILLRSLDYWKGVVD